MEYLQDTEIKNKMLGCLYGQAIGEKYAERIAEWVDTAYNNSDISALDLDEHISISYTLRSLSAALWCYWHATSFEEGLFSVVNEGGDADSNGAISGAILGAKFGYSSIPAHYIENLHNHYEYDNQVKMFITKALQNIDQVEL